MAIFKYEMMQHRKPTMIWAFSMGILIFVMMPTYIDLLTNSTMLTTDMREMWSTNPILAGSGASMEHFFSPLGAYSFVNSFAMIAFATYGMHLGLTMISKESTQKTTDFLLTKPHSRAKILYSKLLAATTCCFIVGGTYIVASVSIMQISAQGEFEPIQLWLISISVLFIQLFFMVLGMLIAVVKPDIGMPVVLSWGTAFIAYTIGSFSRILGNDLVMLLSPYRYFDSNYVIQHSIYEPLLLLLFFGLIVLFIATIFTIFIRKDIK